MSGGSGSKGDSLKRGIRFSHFARMESSQVLEAAILDLVNIFRLKVVYYVVQDVQKVLYTAQNVRSRVGCANNTIFSTKCTLECIDVN